MKFPGIQYTGLYQTIFIDSSEEGGETNQFSFVQGEGGDFSPGGLRAPTWFVAVNANGIFDPEDEDFKLNECFEPSNQDALFCVISGADLDNVKDTLFAKALSGASDNVETFNGSAYAVWQLLDGRLILGGFDNGGDVAAQEAIKEVAIMAGKIEMTAYDCHYSVENTLDIDLLQVRGEDGKLMADITRLLLIDGPAPSRGTKPFY